MKRPIILISAVLFSMAGFAQYEEPEPERVPVKPLEDIEYKVSMQATVSKGTTPLWLNANKYGLSSLDKNNGYLRGSIVRSLSVDDGKKFGIGYGVDLALPVNYTSKFVVQQAYIEGRWLHGVLSVGSKERPMELKDNSLSSGSQTFGINARPVPQVRLELQDWTVPLTRGWLHLRGHIAYGRMTDDNWQHDFTLRQSKYSDDVLYHSKAGYLTIGNQDVFCPWSFEIGLEMASTFGGDTYTPDGNGGMVHITNDKSLSSYYRALIPGGGESVEKGTVYQNDEGNIVGSWLAKVTYEADTWKFSAYADKYFEDHSGMLQLDYNGYGEGENWNVKEKHRYFLYDFKDWMLGLEYRSKYDRALSGIVLEYLYTKYQSGPIYHDHTEGWNEHISGRDNFYNHYIFTGWQHWGQVMGNPLYRSPIYNTDGIIEVQNNRFMAFHLGIDGKPFQNLYYRMLATWQESLGTYDKPFTKKRNEFSCILEGRYDFISQKKWLNGCSIKAACGMDFGSVLGGTNCGFQLTISKSGIFNL